MIIAAHFIVRYGAYNAWYIAMPPCSLSHLAWSLADHCAALSMGMERPRPVLHVYPVFRYLHE